MAIRIGRRKFIARLGGAAAASSLWPLAARAQKPPVPVIGWLSTATAEVQGAAADRAGGNSRKRG